MYTYLFSVQPFYLHVLKLKFKNVRPKKYAINTESSFTVLKWLLVSWIIRWWRIYHSEPEKKYIIFFIEKHKFQNIFDNIFTLKQFLAILSKLITWKLFDNKFSKLFYITTDEFFFISQHCSLSEGTHCFQTEVYYCLILLFLQNWN